MKKTFSAGKWLALALIFAGVISNLQADTAKVVRIKGAARYSTGNNIWLALHEGDVLKPGTVIQTASESSVDLVLGGVNDAGAPTPIVRRFVPGVSPDTQQNIMRLRENTLLAIEKLSSEQTGADVVTDTQLDLRRGSVFGNVKKLSAASKFEVKFANGVAGIRGTSFNLSADGVLKVFIGSVVVSYYDVSGKLVTTVVTAGWELNLNTGSARRLAPDDTGDQLPPESTTPATYIAPDQTVIVVSPTLGDNTPPPPN